MPDILHRIGMRNTTSLKVYQALSSQIGLSCWWTSDTLGTADQEGQSIRFNFGNEAITIRVLELSPNRHVLWEVTDGPAEWYGTKISFVLKEEEDFVILLFKHMDWQAPVDFMYHCSTKWAIFLMSLKQYLETGTGAPYPKDQKIDNWN